MLKLNAYLNFAGKTEEVFNFYKSVFGGEFIGFSRFKDMPGMPGFDKLSESDKNKLMHVSLKVGQNELMGTDALESFGHVVVPGNNISLSLHPDTKEEADRLFAALSVGGIVDQPLADAPWGGYFGMLSDKYGIKWMFNCEAKK